MNGKVIKIWYLSQNTRIVKTLNETKNSIFKHHEYKYFLTNCMELIAIGNFQGQEKKIN